MVHPISDSITALSVGVPALLIERVIGYCLGAFSSQYHLVRGIVRGEKKAVEGFKKEETSLYRQIGKFVSEIGSTKILDVIREEDIEKMVSEKMLFLLKKD